jgi:hypothetical protein
MFQLFNFYVFALPSLPPASLSEHSLPVYLLVLLPATLLLRPLHPMGLQPDHGLTKQLRIPLEMVCISLGH